MTRGFVERHFHPEYLPVSTAIPSIPPPIHTKVQRSGAWSSINGTATYGWDTIIYDRTAANYPGYGMALSGGLLTGVFYAPVAGFYRTTARTGITTSQVLVSFQLLIYKNSTLTASGTTPSAIGMAPGTSQTIMSDVEDTLFVARGDSIYIAFTSNYSYSTGLTGSYSICTFDWAGYS